MIVIRPQPGCDATVAAARALGLTAEPFPLFAVRPLAWQAPDPADFDALLIGSANAMRHGGEGLERLRALPVHAVGHASAAAARAAGFTVTTTGVADMQALLADLPACRLLRLGGRERVPLTPPPGTTIVERVTYASEPLAIPDALVHGLRDGALVLLHSALAARHFAAECDRCGLSRAPVRLAALAPRVADATGTGWADVRTAATPDDSALLALAMEMCEKRAQLNDAQSHEPPPHTPPPHKQGKR